MSIFAVYLSGPDPEAQVAALQKHYPGEKHHQVAARFFLVAAEGITETISQNIGITGNDLEATGLIFKLNAAYSGYEKRAVWEWLSAAEQSFA